MIRDPALLDQADRYSQEAMARVGTMAEIKGTRGAVLAALGRFEEAMPLLQAALQETESLRAKADNACQIAMIEAKCGRIAEAEEYLAEAKKLDPESLLLAQAEDCIREPGRVVPETR